MADPIPFPDQDETKLAAVRAEAQRLASFSETEWKFRYVKSAERLDVDPKVLLAEIREIVRNKAKAEKAETDREKRAATNKLRRESKEKSKNSLFQRLAKMPEDKRMAEILQWCRKHEEDPNTIEIEFREFHKADVEAAEVEAAPVFWPEPVNGSELIDLIINRIQRHAVVSNAGLVACAFWVLLTHVPLDEVTHAPLFTLWSSDPNSGKTTLMHVLSWMCPNRVIEVGSSSSVYQTMAEKPTLFVDEAQDIFEDKKIKKIYDASWTRGQPIWRQIKGIRTPYDVFCHKCIAMLGRDKVDGATQTRMISIRMMTRLPTEVVENFMYADDANLDEIRRKAVRWFMDTREARAAANPDMPASIDNRHASNWRMMFILADLIGGDWPRLLREAAERLAPPADLNVDWHYLGLMELRTYFANVNYRAVSTTEFAAYLTSDPGSLWNQYQGRGKVTAVAITLLFRRKYEVKPQLIGPRRVSGWYPQQLAEFFARTLRQPLPELSHSLKRKVQTEEEIDAQRSEARSTHHGHQSQRGTVSPEDR
jgi:putative DNA primase/helicase